jgi:hypothetical protein
MPQATVSFPYNTIQAYTTGAASQDYVLDIDCTIVPDQTPTLQVTPDPITPLVLLPGSPAGSSTANIISGPSYSSGQIHCTVRVTLDPAQVNSVDGVILYLKVQVIYTFQVDTDGVTISPAVTVSQTQMASISRLLISCSSLAGGLFFGHNSSLETAWTYPSGRLYNPSVPIRRTGGFDSNDVEIDVQGGGGSTGIVWGTAQVSVTVNRTS